MSARAIDTSRCASRTPGSRHAVVVWAHRRGWKILHDKVLRPNRHTLVAGLIIVILFADAVALFSRWSANENWTPVFNRYVAAATGLRTRSTSPGSGARSSSQSRSPP